MRTRSERVLCRITLPTICLAAVSLLLAQLPANAFKAMFRGPYVADTIQPGQRDTHRDQHWQQTEDLRGEDRLRESDDQITALEIHVQLHANLANLRVPPPDVVPVSVLCPR